MPNLDKILEDAVSNPILSEAADEIGKNLLDAMIGELTLIPHPTISKQNVWSTRKQADQDATIDRFKSRVRDEVLRFFQHVMASGNPAAAATLEKVTFTDKGIQATLAINRNSRERHALADFAGEQVVVIMADDLEQYFESMGEVVGTDDQAELDLPPTEPTVDYEDAPEDEPETTETDESDRELAHALSLHGIRVHPEIVARWNSEWLESAWKWIEQNEANESAEMPSFLDEHVAGEQGSVDQATPDAAGTDGGDEQSPATETVPAATESRETEVEPKVVTDKRTVKALIEECLKLAAEIGEGDITKAQFKKKGRDGLFDYIAYANTRKKTIQAANEAGPDNSDADIAALVKILDGLTIHVDALIVDGWSETDRMLVQDYAERMSSGKLPKQIPEILAPYLLGADR